MFRSLLRQWFPCNAAAQGQGVIIKRAFRSLLSFSFFHKSVLLIILTNRVSTSFTNSETTYHKTAIDKKIGGLSHVSYPVS
jgi:hypothetical protein